MAFLLVGAVMLSSSPGPSEFGTPTVELTTEETASQLLDHLVVGERREAEAARTPSE